MKAKVPRPRLNFGTFLSITQYLRMLEKGRSALRAEVRMFEATDNHLDPATREASAQIAPDYWRRQAEVSQATIARLSTRIRQRDHRIELLEMAITRTVVMNQVWAAHLERKLDRLPTRVITVQPQQFHVASERGRGVMVNLPHMTRTLEAIFEVMHEHWVEWDPERPPKSSTIARAIDEKLGLKGQTNGEASRSAQTFAAALRPDAINEVDGRHR
jgi:isopropylmalate/homocitrate/citramalate synthase